MSLSAGTRLGIYEILSALGAGGMGEVYRARDTKLNREVALKILPESFANDPERLARFEREAQVLASLNHPQIAQIYGFEDSSGTRALVMELVEGETLAEAIADRSPHGMEMNETLAIAKQIADALEAAHEQGIIHRDLKPANVKVRADGTVKVLDFGLAKALASAPGKVPAANVSQSPTVTGPAALTGAGMLLGTAAYMSPEQAASGVADKRSDLWAFGAPDRRWLVSTQGGRQPRWNPNGKELFYRDGNKMMAVDVSTRPDLVLSPPRLLFDRRYAFGIGVTIPNYDVSPDGDFVMVKSEADSGRLNVVLNWFDDLKTRVTPANRP